MPSASPPFASPASRVQALPTLAIDLSIATYVSRFAALPMPDESVLQGRFRAQFVGPAWLRLSAGPSVSLAGLRAWWGKELCGYGAAYNLVGKDGGLKRVLPMELSVATSHVDGKACAALRYGKESPFPWPHVIDELRALSPTELLGMSVIDAPLLRRLAFPFLLVREL